MVWTEYTSLRKWGMRYGPSTRVAASWATMRVFSVYAPVSRWISACRATSTPSLVTPVLSFTLAPCRRTVTMASGTDRHTRTGRPALRESSATRGSNLV